MVSTYDSKHNCLGPFANNPPTWIPIWTHKDTFEPPPNTHQEKFIVVSTLCFCLSCCLLLVWGFLLLVFGDEKLLFAEIQ